jgi:predicted MFS family arabinose efflux permease
MISNSGIGSERIAGAPQGLALIVTSTLPITPLLSLVSNVPQLFQHFAGVAHSNVLVPMILTMPSACIALLAPGAGTLLDRFGRRRVLLAAVLLYTVCGLLPLGLNTLPAVLMAQIGVGVGEAIIMPACQTLMGDFFQPEERQRWLGVQGVLGSILATAVVLGGGALGTLSWHAPFLMNLIGAVSFVWLLFWTWEPARSGGGGVEGLPAQAFPWRAMSRIFLVTIPISLLYFIQTVQLGVIFSKLGAVSPALISVLTTVASIGVMIGGWWFRQQKRVNPQKHLALILLSYGIGLTGLALSSSYLSGLGFAVVAQFGNGLTVPVLVGWALGTLDFKYRGRGMGLWTTCFFVGQFLSPMLLAGIVHERGGDFLSAIAAVGIFCAVASAIVWLLGARRGRAAAAAA